MCCFFIALAAQAVSFIVDSILLLLLVSTYFDNLVIRDSWLLSDVREHGEIIETSVAKDAGSSHWKLIWQKNDIFLKRYKSFLEITSLCILSSHHSCSHHQSGTWDYSHWAERNISMRSEEEIIIIIALLSSMSWHFDTSCQVLFAVVKSGEETGRSKFFSQPVNLCRVRISWISE